MAEIFWSIPELKLILAFPNAFLTWDCLVHYLGFYRHRLDTLRAARTVDLQANRHRDEIQRKLGGGLEYLQGLQMKVTLHWNDLSQALRLHEMSQKFN